MGRVVCFANQKGGVGKTTTCVNLCAAVKDKRRKILLIDADPQGNATTGMGVDKRRDVTLYDVLIRGVPAQEAIVQTKYGDVLPANLNLSGAAVELVDAGGGLIVTPRDIDKYVKDAGKLIAYALNMSFHQGLTVSDIDMFVG